MQDLGTWKVPMSRDVCSLWQGREANRQEPDGTLDYAFFQESFVVSVHLQLSLRLMHDAHALHAVM